MVIANKKEHIVIIKYSTSQIRLLAMFFFVYGCQHSEKVCPSYVIQDVQEANGVYAELNQDSVGIDNAIYDGSTALEFRYYYVKDGVQRLFDITNSRKMLEDEFWEFTNDTTSRTVESLLLCSTKEHNNKNGQTELTYFYLNGSRDTLVTERTGLIENYRNIWMHPPRIGLFNLIFSAPWPFVKLPIEENNEWGWSWSYGERWGDRRYVEWDGIVKFDYKYQIQNDTVHVLNGINYPCTQILSEGRSEVGMNRMAGCFNCEYGFLTFTYTNLDGSSISLVATKLFDSSFE